LREALLDRFEKPIQTTVAVGKAYGIHRTTLTRAFHSGALGDAAYRSADAILIDTSHPDWFKWLEAHRSQPRVKGQAKRQM